MKKIKIFYLIPGLFAGGAELMLKKIISKIDKEKFEVIVCSLTKSTYFIKFLDLRIKRLYLLNITGISNFIFEFIKLRRLIKKESPHILHCFLPSANIIGRFATIGYKCKVISSIRANQREKRYYIYIDKLTQKLVNIYMVNSKSLINFEIKYGIDKKKIVLIENGVDFENLKLTCQPEELKKKLNISNSILITTIAHLRKEKDYPTTLQALTHLQKDIDFLFLSVGSDDLIKKDSQKIKNLIQELHLKNVKLLGLRNDIPDILAITDIWVSSTLYEGQSNSLLEAMAMKKPIITTNIPENAEVVRDGKEALLIPIKSPYKMANAIKLLIKDENLSKKIASNAYKRVHRKYNINKTVKKLEKLYLSLIFNRKFIAFNPLFVKKGLKSKI